MIHLITIRPACINAIYVFFRGLWINYGSVNWERCYVTRRGCRPTASVNLPSRRKHTCNLSALTAADRKREREREGGRRELGDTACDGGERWQIGRKIKGDWMKDSLLGRWPTAFLYRREAVTEAKETPSPFLLLLELTPLVTERSSSFPWFHN